MDHREMTLNQLLAERAAQTPHLPFLQWQQEEPMSYGDVETFVRRLAGGLTELGVGPGSTVLMMLPNGLEIIQTWFACNAIGAIEVPVNVFLRGAFLEHVLNDSEAQVMVIHESFVEHLEGLPAPRSLKTLVVVGDGHSTTPAPHGLDLIGFDAVARHAPVESVWTPRWSDVSAIYYTSGTTGPAKGIIFTYGQGCVTSRNYLGAIGASEDDVFFCCMPLFHSNAQVLQIAAPLMVGGRVSVWPEFSASQWLSQVRAVGATVSNTLGVMMEFLYRQPVRADDADNPLRVLQTIPAPPSLAAAFEERFGVRCIDGYGLTDTGMLSFRRYNEPLVPGSSGRPVDDFEVIVADPETDQPLPAGSVGEILARPRVPFGFMRGYWRRPEATVEAWRNLWFHTGDAGMFDENGLLYFRDRMGDSIRVRGENISSAEIESVVASHEGVQQCAAVAVSSDVGDYDVLVAVVPVDGVEIDPSGLLRFCEGRMPYYAIPRYVDVVPSLPMTATQKVRKVELRKRGVVESTWDRVAANHVVKRR